MEVDSNDCIVSSDSDIGESSATVNKSIGNRRKNKFKDNWKSQFDWIIRTKDDSTAKCSVCGISFSIANGGITKVKQHMKSTKHIRNASGSKYKPITNFLCQSNNGAGNLRSSSAAAEASFCYHSVMHSHSYKSADCSAKLYKSMFSDSNVAANFSCGKTKCSKIVTNILAKYAIEKVIDDLKDNHPFSIATDASNKGNIKMFPLLIRYFKKDSGISTKLLKFFDSDSETSKDIANCLKSFLDIKDLNLVNVTSFSADNANVNFGKNQSILVELSKENPDIIGVGCLCHVINNAFKISLKLLKFEIDDIVIKVFNEFSSSTKKTSNLKEVFQFCDLEWSEMLRHVPSRWLSLTPAIERLYKNYAAIKSYFLSQSDCSFILRTFFELDTSEAYLGFVHTLGHSLCCSIKKLEAQDSLVVIDMFQIMKIMREKLIQQRTQEYYGFVAENVCSKCDNVEEVNLFKKRANAVLLSITSYIEKRFDFDNNKFEKLSTFHLNPNISFHDFKDVITLFSIKHIDLDLLFDEFLPLKSFSTTVDKDKPVDEKWKEFLNSGTYPNLEKICNFIFSIPHSNAACERIFSLMVASWRKERNRLSIENLESELLVKTNFNYTCTEFYNFLNTDIGKVIVKNIQKSDKYF